MGWGGRRVGSGRKPVSGRAVVLGMDGARLADGQIAQAVAADDPLLAPPPGATVAQRRYWRLWAPLAIAQRTLTHETVPGFFKLCAAAVVMEPLERQMLKLKPGTAAWAELHLSYLKAGKDLRIAMQDYKLCAFGKPEQAAGRKPATASPWAKVGR